jgi:hypothetical protein
MFEFSRKEFNELTKTKQIIEYILNSSYMNSQDDCMLIAESEQGNIYQNIDEVELDEDFRTMHEIKLNNLISNPPCTIDCDFIHNKTKSQSKLKQIYNNLKEKFYNIINDFSGIVNFSFFPF